MLVLFDVDLTLLDARGAGLRSMEDAGRDLYGPDFSADGVDFAGRLDPLILCDLLARAGVEPGAAELDRLRGAYRARLARLLAGGHPVRALDGAHEIVDALAEPTRPATVGLLTGNFEETGRLKLGAAGFDADRFAVRVWGDDSPHDPPARDHLPAVGIERDAALRGQRLDGGRVVVVGDTVHDVACARAHGCRSLAVATGRASAGELAGAGADLVANDLADTERLVRWIMA